MQTNLFSKTTDLSEIRRHPNRFTWGYVTEIVDVGNYTIVVTQTEKAGPGPYHLYVDGKDTHHSYTSLDQALVGGIAHKNLERNAAEHMAMAACKVLGVK